MIQRSRSDLLEHNPLRSWPIRVLGLLLLVQTAALVGVSLVSSARINWRQIVGSGTLPQQALDVFVLGGMFIPCAVLALVAAVGLLAGLRIGWLLAMLAQAILLGGCLWLYVSEGPAFIYPLMLSSIVIVLYLNSRDVRVAFHLQPISEPMETTSEI